MKLRPGRLFAVYLAGYSLLRLWVESLRVDPANELAGLRVNTWMALTVLIGSTGFLLVDHLRHRGETTAPPEALGDDVSDELDASEDVDVSDESDDLDKLDVSDELERVDESGASDEPTPG
jgi:Prolipoprotein diacylglyceryl transferase